jgi:hypothetical protein
VKPATKKNYALHATLTHSEQAHQNVIVFLATMKILFFKNLSVKNVQLNVLLVNNFQDVSFVKIALSDYHLPFVFAQCLIMKFLVTQNVTSATEDAKPVIILIHVKHANINQTPSTLQFVNVHPKPTTTMILLISNVLVAMPNVVLAEDNNLVKLVLSSILIPIVNVIMKNVLAVIKALSIPQLACLTVKMNLIYVLISFF